MLRLRLGENIRGGAGQKDRQVLLRGKKGWTVSFKVPPNPNIFLLQSQAQQTPSLILLPSQRQTLPGNVRECSTLTNPNHTQQHWLFSLSLSHTLNSVKVVGLFVCTITLSSLCLSSPTASGGTDGVSDRVVRARHRPQTHTHTRLA